MLRQPTLVRHRTVVPGTGPSVNRLNMTDIFVARFPAIPPLGRAVLDNDLTKLKSLISEGVQVNAVDADGFTVLYFAANTKKRTAA